MGKTSEDVPVDIFSFGSSVGGHKPLITLRKIYWGSKDLRLSILFGNVKYTVKKINVNEWLNKRPFIKGIEDSRTSARSQRARVLHWEDHATGQKVGRIWWHRELTALLGSEIDPARGAKYLP